MGRDVLVLPTRCVVPGVVMSMAPVRHGHRHQVEVTVPDAAPRDELVGKLADAPQRSAQHAGFQAMIMVEVHVQGGHRKIMVIVLGIGQLPGKVALVMVINIGQNADAVAVGILVGPLAGQKSAQQVAYGLGSTAVAEPLPITLESVGKLAVQGYCESLGHAIASIA